MVSKVKQQVKNEYILPLRRLAPTIKIVFLDWIYVIQFFSQVIQLFTSN